MNDYLAVALGVVFAGIGGELFVRGVVGLARWARVSPGIIAATVAAFATSSPELTVSITAAMAGDPQIALGDALGSNVVNVALILGITLSISAIQTSRSNVKRDFPVALLAPVLTAVFLLDGVLSRIEGLLLLCMFVAWFVVGVINARKQRSVAEEVLGKYRGLLAAVQCAIGFAFLIFAGRFIVSGATGIAVAFGIDKFVIGATVVAIGTSAPEIATAVIAKLRGHDEVGFGVILGSNIFNGLVVIPIASLISPIVVNWREVVVALGFGLLTLALIFPPRSGLIKRSRGVLLLVLYGIYLAMIILL